MCFSIWPTITESCILNHLGNKQHFITINYNVIFFYIRLQCNLYITQNCVNSQVRSHSYSLILGVQLCAEGYNKYNKYIILYTLYFYLYSYIEYPYFVECLFSI